MSVLRTLTGEPYQPCRVYYQIFDRPLFLETLGQLQCFRLDPDRDQWQWLFDFEARRLRFERIYYKIPGSHRPVILGELKFQDQTQLQLMVYSFDRLLQGILFLDKHIPRQVAKAQRMHLVNRFFGETELSSPLAYPELEAWFDRLDIHPHQADVVIETIEALMVQHPDQTSREAAISAYLETLAQRPRPEVEELPVNFYEDGIISLELVLNTRRAEAEEKWRNSQSTCQSKAS